MLVKLTMNFCGFKNILILSSLLMITKGSGINPTSITFSDTRRHSRLDVPVVVSIKLSEPYSCAAHCMNDVQCRAINYNKRNNECELLYKTLNDRDYALKAAEGWTYYGPNSRVGHHLSVKQRES